MNNTKETKSKQSIFLQLGLLGSALLLTSIILSLVSNKFASTDGWVSYLILLTLVGVILYSCWILVKNDQHLSFPKWLSWLIFFALFLRLFAGVLWNAGLPEWGYGSPVEQAGYIMSDAHARDTSAWDLAISDQPLVFAFGKFRNVDQYGGMLFLSALIYRFIGGPYHQPLQVIILTAAISSLAVLFTWAFAYRLLNGKVAVIAACIVAIFPDAVILASSQMREAFLMTFVASAVYGLVRYVQDRATSALVWIFISLLLMLPFSPPIAGVFLVMFVILAISMDGWAAFKQPRFWLIVGGTALVALIGIWLAWERIAPDGINNPFALFGWWVRESARWQAYFVKRSSPLIRRIINTTPDWVNTPILLGYGILQPFLPGALLDQGLPIWKGIAIWRAVGWTLLLPFLIVAPFVLGSEKSKKKLAIGLITVVWMGILIAALRSGGDLWDNPRYRVVFISLQAVLAAWVWVVQRSNKNPWVYRAIMGLGIILVWFIPWYLQRSGLINWPIDNVFVTLAFGLITVIILFIILHFWGRRKSMQSNSENK